MRERFAELTACEVQKATAEAVGERARSDPGTAVVRERAGGHEQVHVRMPLERAAPGVQHGEGADLPAEPAAVAAECGEGREGGTAEHGEQHALVVAHDAPELGGQREDDVEVLHGQEQVALSRDPAGGGIMAALRASAVVAGVKEQVLVAARGAPGEVAAERTGAAARDRAHGVDVAARHGGAVAREVVLTMPTDDVGEQHGAGTELQVGHQAVDDILEALDAGLGDVHVELGGAQGLVTEDGLDGAQGDAGFEQVRRVAVAQGVDAGVLGEGGLLVGGGESLLERGLVHALPLGGTNRKRVEDAGRSSFQ
jgi:hypothetical protein